MVCGHKLLHSVTQTDTLVVHLLTLSADTENLLLATLQYLIIYVRVLQMLHKGCSPSADIRNSK